MRAPSELGGCLLTGVLIIVGMLTVAVFFMDYGWWTLALMALALFGPQIAIPFWRDRQERKDFLNRHNSN